MATSYTFFFLFALFAMILSVDGKDPDMGENTIAIVQKHGYPIEAHNVTTADGYILTVFRIKHGKGNAAVSPGAPILLQHALLCSSFDWVNQSPNQSLAFILADAGFDVWLGNNRGNQWGLGHETLSVDSDAFWDFSWDEMALMDLPATVDFVLTTTKHAKLAYVGHSEGTTQAFSGFSRNATLSQQISLFVALAPVAYVHGEESPVFTALSLLDTARIFQLFGIRKFLPSGSILNKLAPGICSILPTGCDVAIFLFCGPSRHINATRLPVFLTRTPAGTSVKNMEHWTQQVKHNNFRMYDYGNAERNLAKYNQTMPPSYKLSDMNVPVALFTGGHDVLGDKKDVAILLDSLPTASIVHVQDIPSYAHLDFSWGEDANSMVYPDVLRLLVSYTA